MGGATIKGKDGRDYIIISIHAPRGGSDFFTVSLVYHISISIHAPRGGSDVLWLYTVISGLLFQSTLPVGGATVNISRSPFLPTLISIHAPRGGSDSRNAYQYGVRTMNFNPRSPWGERPDELADKFIFKTDFNPRSPWGERP